MALDRPFSVFFISYYLSHFSPLQRVFPSVLICTFMLCYYLYIIIVFHVFNLHYLYLRVYLVGEASSFHLLLLIRPCSGQLYIQRLCIIIPSLSLVIYYTQNVFYCGFIIYF